MKNHLLRVSLYLKCGNKFYTEPEILDHQEECRTFFSKETNYLSTALGFASIIYDHKELLGKPSVCEIYWALHQIFYSLPNLFNQKPITVPELGLNLMVTNEHISYERIIAPAIVVKIPCRLFIPEYMFAWWRILRIFALFDKSFEPQYTDWQKYMTPQITQYLSVSDVEKFMATPLSRLVDHMR